MTYEVSADWIIFNEADYRKVTVHKDRCWECRRGPITVNDNTVYCINSGVISRFRNGRFRVIKGKIFLDTLQEALDTFNPAALSKYDGSVYSIAGGIVCCEDGLLYLTEKGFITKRLTYTGRRVSKEDIYFAFKNFHWIKYNLCLGRLK